MISRVNVNESIQLACKWNVLHETYLFSIPLYLDSRALHQEILAAVTPLTFTSKIPFSLPLKVILVPL